MSQYFDYFIKPRKSTFKKKKNHDSLSLSSSGECVWGTWTQFWHWGLQQQLWQQHFRTKGSPLEDMLMVSVTLHHLGVFFALLMSQIEKQFPKKNLKWSPAFSSGQSDPCARWGHQRSSSMLKLLLLLLVFEAPQDSRGSDITPAPLPSSIRRPPRPFRSVSPMSDIRSGEKTVAAPWDSSRSVKVRASRPREGVTREEEEGEEEEEKGWSSGGESRVWGSREEEEDFGGGELEEEEERPWTRAWSSNSCKTKKLEFVKLQLRPCDGQGQ